MAHRVLIVGNDPTYFIRHRRPLALALARAGDEVHVATPSLAAAAEIARDFTFHPIPLKRGVRHVLSDVATFFALWRLFRRIRPDVVYLATIKPIVYGGLAARLAGVPAVACAITGLGYAFIARGFVSAVLRTAIWAAYRVAFGHPNCTVLFENRDDRELFVRRGVVRDDRAEVVPSSTVDLEEFAFSLEPEGTPVVVLPSRMLWDKGVGEFVGAATKLREMGVDARFALVGDTDQANPAAVPRAQLEAWRTAGTVEWWGYRSDMPAVLANAAVVCLPSYREGLPRALMEAAAIGRACVAADAPGSRDVVDSGHTGVLVPVRSTELLAEALHSLLQDRALRTEMGRRGRELAVDRLSPEHVIGRTMEIYRGLVSRIRSEDLSRAGGVAAPKA